VLIDAADPSRCLTVRTVAADGTLRIIGDDPLSLVDGLALEQAPDSSALRFGDVGSDFEVVTRGEFTAPDLSATTITVGAPEPEPEVGTDTTPETDPEPEPTIATASAGPASPDTQLPDRLAFTGAEVGVTGAAAAALLGLGTLLLVLRRRVRRS
jgi:hypothetical protein